MGIYGSAYWLEVTTARATVRSTLKILTQVVRCTVSGQLHYQSRLASLGENRLVGNAKETLQESGK